MIDIPHVLGRFVGNSQIPLTLTAPGDRGWPVVAINDAFERLTGYGSADIAGRDCRILQGQRTQPAARHSLRSALQNGADGFAVITNYRSDGSEFDNFVSLFPVLDAEDATVLFVGSQYEIPTDGRVGGYLDHMRFLKDSFADLNGGALGELYIECGGLSAVGPGSLVAHRLRNLAGAA